MELLYCVLQLTIAMAGRAAKHDVLTAVLLLTVCLTYILYVNPTYMNRQLVRKKER